MYINFKTKNSAAGNLFPIKEQDLQELCNKLEIENSNSSTATITEIYDDDRANKLLKDKVFKLEELNYFTKNFELLSDFDKNIFYAVSEAKNYDNLKDMINLTLNTHHYSLVSDFSNLNAKGKQLYLNANGGASVEYLKTFDGEQYVVDIMKNNTPLPTSYGFVYVNDNDEVTIYNGNCFAPIGNSNPITLCLNTDSDRDFLYLPCQESEISKALDRLDVTSLEEVTIEVEDYNTSFEIYELLTKDIANIDILNNVTAQLKELDNSSMEQLTALAENIQIETQEELSTLVKSMFEFEFYKNIKNPVEYGKYLISESGYFNYDENLEEYIDFARYGEEKINNQKGIFTNQGYISYLGYNEDMIKILNTNLNMNLEIQDNTQTLNIYMPLKIVTFEQIDDYGYSYQSEYEEELESYELSGYTENIKEELNKIQDFGERGLMKYYDKIDTVNAKVKSYLLDVEEVNGDVFGVARVEINAPLNAKELAMLKEEITAQSADGVGEILEQREVKICDRNCYVSLWNSDNYYLRTSEEMGFEDNKFDISMEM